MADFSRDDIKELDLYVAQGKTFTRVVRWESPDYTYKAITNVARVAPVRITAVAHGLTDGWRAAPVSIEGMTELNAEHTPPRDRDFHRVTVIGPDTVDINTINASQYTAYSEGGYLQFFAPQSLAGKTARLTVKDQIGGTVLLELTSATDDGIVISDTLKTITFTFTDEQTGNDLANGGVWELEVEDDETGEIDGLFYGAVFIEPKEVIT